MDIFLKAACRLHPSPDVTFKKYHLINGSLAFSAAKFPPVASGHCLGALICWPALPGGAGACSPLGRATGLLAPRPCPHAAVILSTTPALPHCRPQSQPGTTPDTTLPETAPPASRPGILISHLSDSVSLSNKPSTLILLIIGEQIFPQIIRQLKSYSLPLRTIFNPDLNVIYTSHLP